jgi:hypothetical protein
MPVFRLAPPTPCCARTNTGSRRSHVTSTSPIQSHLQHFKTRKSQFCRNQFKLSPICRFKVKNRAKTIFPPSDRQRHLLTTGGTKLCEPGRPFRVYSISSNLRIKCFTNNRD